MEDMAVRGFSSFSSAWQKLIQLTDFLGDFLERANNRIWKRSFVSAATRSKQDWQLTPNKWQELLGTPQLLASNDDLNHDLSVILNIKDKFVEYLNTNTLNKFINSTLPKLLQDWLICLEQVVQHFTNKNYSLPKQKELENLPSEIQTYLLFSEHLTIAEIIAEEHLKIDFSSLASLIKIAPALNSALEELLNHQKDPHSLTTLLKPYFPELTDQTATKIKQEYYYRKLSKRAQQWLVDKQLDIFSIEPSLKIDARIFGYPNPTLYIIALLNQALAHQDQKALSSLENKLQPTSPFRNEQTPDVYSKTST